MNFTTVFSRGNKLAVIICLIIVATGIGTNIVLGRLSAASDDIRIEQLRLAEFKAQLNAIPGHLSAVRLSQGSLGPTETVSQQLNRLTALVLAGNFRISQQEVNNFVQASNREIKAISVSRLLDANKIHDSEVTPAYELLISRIEQFDRQYASEAGHFRQRGQTLKNVTLGVAGLLILITVIAFQIISVSDYQRERERHAQAMNGLRFAAVVQNSTDVILLSTRKGIVTLINEASKSAWGLPQKSCIGKHYLNLFSSVDSEDMLKAFNEALAKPNVDIETSIRIEVSPGVQHFFQLHIRNLLNNVHIGGLLLTFHDITARAAVEEALTHQAMHDRLTGLPNRGQVMIRLDEALKKARITGHRAGALFIDLDDFKQINDTLGHEIGDQLLVQVAKRIQSAVRPSDMAARLGGDEFIVLFDNTDGKSAGKNIANRIAEQLAIPFHLANQDLSVTASIGVAMSEEVDEEPNDLLRRADAAMYEAKHQGKAGYVIFDPTMTMMPDKSANLGSDLQSAVEEEDLEVVFQPIMSLDGQKIREVETMVRWRHPSQGLISPKKLATMLKEQSLSPTVEVWMMSEVCRQIALWSASKLISPDSTYCLNISFPLLTQPTFVEDAFNLAMEFGIQPQRITFEIPEHDVLEDLERSRNVFRALQARGFRVAIDDFGIWQSKMDYLNDLPVNTVKLDSTLVEQIGEDSSTMRIIKAIVDVAHSLGMSITGQGVDSVQQYQLLKDLQCDYGQGAFFGRPLTAEEQTNQLRDSEQKGLGQVL